MLPGAQHALRALTPTDTLFIQRGCCVRHRFSRSTCMACFTICPANALTWGEAGLQWNVTKCQSCLLCSAACPSGALKAQEVSFVSLLKELVKVDNPIIACTGKPETIGHVRLPCLGALANLEILLAFSLALGKTITLNLSACGGCQNNAVVAPLEKELQKLAKLPLTTLPGVAPVYNAEDLNFKEHSYSRREFFTLLRNRSQQTGLCIAERLKTEQEASYGDKTLPASRNLLLQVFKHRKQERRRLYKQLFPQRESSPSCRSCTGCVGICPTGALRPPTVTEPSPGFAAECCIACKLCHDFCSHSVIHK